MDAKTKMEQQYQIYTPTCTEWNGECKEKSHCSANSAELYVGDGSFFLWKIVPINGNNAIASQDILGLQMDQANCQWCISEYDPGQIEEAIKENVIIVKSYEDAIQICDKLNNSTR